MNSSDFYFRFNRSIKLERLEIVDRILTNDDLCRVVDIPSHIPIKMLRDNLCSCSVFYLYRHLRHTLNQLVLKDLTPSCYLKLPLDEIEQKENQCSFNQQIKNCHQMQGEVNIYVSNRICPKKSPLLTKKQYHTSTSASSIFILICFITVLVCIYILSTQKRRIFVMNIFHKYNLHRHRQKLPIFSADSYQQLTHTNDHCLEDDTNQQQTSNKIMKIIIKYNAATDQTHPYLHTNQSDFITSNDIDEQENEDLTLQLNTNPLSDIEDNHLV